MSNANPVALETWLRMWNSKTCATSLKQRQFMMTFGDSKPFKAEEIERVCELKQATPQQMIDLYTHLLDNKPNNSNNSTPTSGSRAHIRPTLNPILRTSSVTTSPYATVTEPPSYTSTQHTLQPHNMFSPASMQAQSHSHSSSPMHLSHSSPASVSNHSHMSSTLTHSHTPSPHFGQSIPRIIHSLTVSHSSHSSMLTVHNTCLSCLCQ